MKTMYYQTSHFISHTDNLVDLGEYRSKLEQVQRASLARRREPLDETLEAEADGAEEPGFQPVVLTMSPGQRRRVRRERRSWTLDACASLAVVLMTLVFVMRVMLCV